MRFAACALLAALGVLTLGPVARAQTEPRYPHLANVYLATLVNDQIIEALAHWDVVVLQNSVWKPEQLDALRARNHAIKIFFYVIAYDVTLKPTTPWNQVNTAYARSANLWWYDADGHIASDWPGTAMVNVMPGAPRGPLGTWREFFLQRLVELVQEYPQLDGLFLDNFWRQISWQQSYRRLDSDCNPRYSPAGCDGVMDTDAELDAGWNRSMREFVTALRARFEQLPPAPGRNGIGKPQQRPLAIISNGSDDYFEWLNGTLTEFFPSGQGDVDVDNPYGYNWNHEMFDFPGGYTVAPFRAAPFRVSILNSESRGSMWAPIRDPAFERHKRFTLASSLLGAGYYSLDSGHAGNQNLWWEPEYDHGGRGKGYLGYPLGPARRIHAATGPEMLANSDFSGQTSGWLSHPYDALGRLSVDAGTWHTRPAAARIDVQNVHASGAYKVWQAPLQLQQHQSYTLSFWAMGTPGQTLAVHLYGEGCPDHYCMPERRVGLSMEWRRFETSFASGGTAAAGLNFFVTRPGIVWLDDVSLRPGDTSLFRRDFEHGIVLVNYTNETQTVELETAYYRLLIPNDALYDGGAVVRDVLPPSDAHILLRDSPGPLPAPPPSDAPGPGGGRAFLDQNEPNPFNPQTRIRFRVPAGRAGVATVHVRVAVYDARGELVRQLVDRELAGGVDHFADWNGLDTAGRAAPSGIYLYRITAPGFTQARTMVLAR